MVGWFEIPVTNMQRATTFYENVFNVKLQSSKFDNIDMAWFPWNHNQPGAPGSLVMNENYYKPDPNGVLIYFSSRANDLNVELSRVVQAGGQIAIGKTLISEEIGYMAIFMDTEGNRIALHSTK